MQNGVSVGTLLSSGGLSGSVLSTQAAQEVTIDTAGLSAELEEGGPRINYIPRDGGNTYTGTGYVNWAGHSLQASNLTPRLLSLGLLSVDSIKTLYELSPGFGGPLKHDAVWFYGSGRYTVSDRNVAGMFLNPNGLSADPRVYSVFTQDLTQGAVNSDHLTDREMRITWQTPRKLKLAFHFVDQARCACPGGISATRSADAASITDFPISRFYFGDWSWPVTSHLLFEGDVNNHLQRYAVEQGSPTVTHYGNPQITDQGTGITWNQGSGWKNIWSSQPYYRASLTYITGAHSIKVGVTDMFGLIDATAYAFNPLSYRFNNGVPNQITEAAYNYQAISHQNNFGSFVQDKWTIRRLTLTGGVRFDYFGSGFPEQTLYPGFLLPNRNKTLPAQDELNWKDITPRAGVVYDLFGNGKTAIRFSAAKYLLAQNLNGMASNSNPVNTMVLNASRSWTDTNKNFVPDCNLLNPLANSGADTCGALSDSNFGTLVPGSAYDPDLIGGWGHRNYNWEFSAGVQHQLLPRMSVDVAVFHRLYGNFWAVDNLALAPSDFTQFTIPAPVNALLPGGGGYPVNAYDLNPNKFGVPQQLYSTLSDKIAPGGWKDHWTGFDVGVNLRMRDVFVQGGGSFGKRDADNCDLIAKDPEMSSYVGSVSEVVGSQGGANAAVLVSPGTWQTACTIHTPWTAYTQVKLIGRYTIPRVDVLISGTFQNLPGSALSVTYAAPNAIVAPVLGRSLSGGAANSSINIISPGTLYTDRVSQLDLRFGKKVTLGQAYGKKFNSVLSVDVYNALNTDVATGVSSALTTLFRPTSVLPGRFVKLGIQLDF
jgi:hypothetical protein